MNDKCRELLPCPFCGSTEVEAVHNSEFFGQYTDYFISCKNECLHFHENKEQAIKAWNQRVTL